MSADNENRLNIDSGITDGLDENRFNSEMDVISDGYPVYISDIIEDYCLNGAIDEALEAPLMTRDDALVWLESEKI